MIEIKSLIFFGLTMQAFGTLFLTVQLWGPAWGLEGPLHLKDERGIWRNLVRDGVLLHVVGSAVNIWAITWIAT